MRCVDTQKRIKPYLEHKLPDEELAPFLEHVQECADCHEDLQILMAVYDALDNDSEDDEEDVDYDFVRVLDERLLQSEKELEKRSFASVIRISIVILAQIVLVFVLFSSVRTRMGQRNLSDRLGYSLIETDETEELLTEAMTGLPGDTITAESVNG